MNRFTEFFYSLADAPKTSLVLNLKLIDALKQGNQRSFEAMSDILKLGEKKIYEAIDEREQLIVIQRIK